ncbi:unnamed protein product [Hymenolepis diminuta]|uniref:Integrase catalytic domain-containing protein n=1 Tax=Hymenolepis diminuta TaxID=6216 RepID=A0A564Y2Y1_HYMDI|nr:unnamed protein product [Hymenolepis diminuta]
MPVDDNYKEPEEIGHTKPVSLANETVSKVVPQNASEAVILFHRDLLCSQTNVSWSHICFSLIGTTEGISCLNLADFYSKWSEIISIRSAITGTTINGLRQVFAHHGIPKVIVARNVTHFSSIRFEDFLSGVNVSRFHFSKFQWSG